jgi:cellulose synthase/poly-beta-1,6-N-acetylglucosamine synthase-like glycosyltransferase
MSEITALSIVIPTWNERENIGDLLKEITICMRELKIDYEIIFVDDKSTDGTPEEIERFQPIYPSTILVKVGKKGKPASVIQGVKAAQHEFVAVIDADLQYSPSHLPQMIHQINQGYDIVVASHQTGAIDSGIKLFRKEIFDRFKIRPLTWSLDHEFITKAEDAGYKAASMTVQKLARRPNQRKLLKVGRGFEHFMNRLRVATRKSEIYNFNKRLIDKLGHGFHYNGAAFVKHTKLENHESAFFRLSSRQISAILLFIALLVLSSYVNWNRTVIVAIAIMTLLYFGDLLFNLYLIYRSFARPTELTIDPDKIAKASETSWPAYTILCPLYKEAHVIPQFVEAMSRMDYPKDKLQVMLLLEEDDIATISAARKLNLPDFVEIMIVPDSSPKTKPKACNYGLLQARGEYTTIYDAEDVPDPQQLKKAVLAFKELGSKTVCIQAKLNFYNPKQNLLTRIFTAEYSLWFDLVLTGLHSVGAPIPLGGTSNHFPTAKLRELNGWDAFNVTEDCDLGMRLVKKDYHTAVIDSVTYEEANSGLMNWLLQRTRWIKGYIQTYFVHMRGLKDFKSGHKITFQLVVGGKILSMIINPLMWVITVSYFVFRATFGAWIEQFYPAPVLYMAVFSLIFGNFLYMYYYMIGCAKREYDDLIKYVIFVPFYWLGMSIAAWRAMGEMITNPHYWSKTKHGLHLNNAKAMAHAGSVVGYDIGSRHNLAGQN